jgi:hypothetical protein
MPTKIKTQDIANSAINGAKLAVLTTKGDIITFDNGHIRIPAGNNNQVLTANNTVTGGLAWSNMPRLLYLNTSIPAGNTVNNTSSETTFSSFYPIPANFLLVGDLITIKLQGTYGATNPANPVKTLNCKIKMGTVTLFNFTCPITSDNSGWLINASCIVHSVGTNGKIDAQGKAEFSTSQLLANNSLFTVNTTVNNNITAAVTWTLGELGNTITLRQMIVELSR